MTVRFLLLEDTVKRLLTGTSILVGLALMAFSMLTGCGSSSKGYRTSSAADAAIVATGVALCVLASDGASAEPELDLTDVPETTPESLLGETSRYDARHEAAGVSRKEIETVPEHLLRD